jgi:hypothetical protein
MVGMSEDIMVNCRICGQRIDEDEFDENDGLCAICRDDELEEEDAVLFL